MFAWIWRGLRTGIVTTRYPGALEAMPSAYRGRMTIDPNRCDPSACHACADACLPQAIVVRHETVRLDLGQCITCGLCLDACPTGALAMSNDFELAVRRRDDLITQIRGGSRMDMRQSLPVETPAVLPSGNGHAVGDPPADLTATREALRRRIAPFRRSLHIRHVDAGSDGSEEAEILALTNPYYDINRLGLFFTPTPRHADLLLVTGPVTRAMADPLRRTYEAMPFPKLVVAAGTSACGGGIFGPSYATLGGVDKVLAVDVYVPGTPPSPLALLYGLLLAIGRLEQKIHAARFDAHVGGKR